MAWLACDAYPRRTVFLHTNKPTRHFENLWWVDGGVAEEIPSNVAFMLVGRTLNWEDEPVEFNEVKVWPNNNQTGGKLRTMTN